MSRSNRIDSDSLSIFLQKNKDVNFRQSASLQKSRIRDYDWTGLEESQDFLIQQLKIYHCLLLILPDDRDDLALKLMTSGQSSLAKIAQMPDDDFVKNNLQLFGGDRRLAAKVHQRAVQLLQKAMEQQQIRNSISAQANSETNMNLRNLKIFLQQNQEIDFRITDLLHLSYIDTFNWENLEPNKKNLIKQLKAYQRILRIVPHGREDLAIKLLEGGVHSSLQIANMPKQKFTETCQNLFDDATLAEQIYARAIALRKAVTLQYIARVQQAEPHVHTRGLRF